ncbi:MAG TPA: CRTAC1 family protein [Vicinamibacterales bacterium]|nr:CRTAC1 family protein [Vicinamibacterales bacterium]
MPCASGVIAAYLALALLPPESVTFTDVTKDSGITFSHVWSPDKKYILESMSGGVALFDFDNDGLLDVYLVNSPTVATAANPRSARSELWRNRGDGTFADVTDKAGVGYPGWGMGTVAADYDNDGWDDLYVTCYGPNKLYRNNRDGTFADVTARAGVGDARWSTGAAFADYDGDGWLDLFVANYVNVRLEALPEFGKGKFCEFHGIPVQCGPRGLGGSGDSLYHNKGDGTFEDVSTKAGVADPDERFGMGVAWSDIDGDGRPDLYVANDAGPNFLYRNNGNGTFVDVALQAGTALSENGKEQGSMGVAIGDYNHSGGWSIFVTNFSDEYNALYRRDKGLQFTDVSFASQTATPSIPLVGWGTHFLDYDNDGWLDLLVVNGHVYPQVERAGSATRYAQRRLLYRNNRTGTFTDVTSTAGPALGEPSVSRGSAAGDLDNDGDLDVVINNLDGAPTVLRNDGGNRNNFLVVDLEGRAGNRSAIGAIVTLTATDLVQRAERRSGDSYLSHSDARLHFGLGTRTKVDAVEVRWPNGTVQRFGEIPANTFIRIVEGAPAPETIVRSGTRNR